MKVHDPLGICDDRYALRDFLEMRELAFADAAAACVLISLRVTYSYSEGFSTFRRSRT